VTYFFLVHPVGQCVSTVLLLTYQYSLPVECVLLSYVYADILYDYRIFEKSNQIYFQVGSNKGQRKLHDEYPYRSVYVVRAVAIRHYFLV